MQLKEHGRDARTTLVFGDGFHDRLRPHQHAGFAQEVEAFDVDGAAVERGDDDRKIFGLAQVVFLVRNQAGLFLGQAQEFRDGIIKKSLGHVLFIEGEVILEVVAEGFFVLLVAFAGEAFDQAAIGEGFAGEAGEFRNGLSAAGDGDKMAAAGEEPHGDFETAKDTRPASVNGEEFRMQTAVIDEDRQASAAWFFVMNTHGTKTPQNRVNLR